MKLDETFTAGGQLAYDDIDHWLHTRSFGRNDQQQLVDRSYILPNPNLSVFIIIFTYSHFRFHFDLYEQSDVLLL